MGKRELLLGKAAFEAYSDAMLGITHDGKRIPSWEKLGDRVQFAWTAAALAVEIHIARRKD